ncbi:MAG: BrnA antitoxin family protein [Chloroflexi bacterium]|nr:BrnA antitoxin family protein [Chloroflexota bacterium]
MDENRLSSISKSKTDEAIGEFWDTHDFTDFDTDAPDIEFEVTCAVPIEVELFNAIEKEAHKHGVQVETLVNLWLQQKLAEQT